MSFFTLPTAALSWWFFAVSVHLGGVLTSYKKYNDKNNKDLSTNNMFSPLNSFKPPPSPPKPIPHYEDTKFPKVTILRPLKGLDFNIESNLNSAFLQDYPPSHYEIVFCVAESTDPVIPLARSFIRMYPSHSARLIIGDVHVGANPKINNLIRGYDSALHDIVWIIDSNIWVSPGTLKRSVLALEKPGVGLVHHLPVAVHAMSLGSKLEMLFLNSVHARAYLAINILGPSSCVIGKSTLFRRSDLDLCGGLCHFGQYMAEDNMIGQAIWDLGLRHELTCDRAWQPLGEMQTHDYFIRRQRWGRIRKYTVKYATLAEPLGECMVLGAFFAYGITALLNHSSGFWVLYCIHMMIWMLMDFYVGMNVAHVNELPIYQFIGAWLVRELSCLPTYIWAMAGSTVKWRSFMYQLHDGGIVTQIPGPKVTEESTRHLCDSGPLIPPISWATDLISVLTPPYSMPTYWRPQFSISPLTQILNNQTTMNQLPTTSKIRRKMKLNKSTNSVPSKVTSSSPSQATLPNFMLMSVTSAYGTPALESPVLSHARIVAQQSHAI